MLDEEGLTPAEQVCEEIPSDEAGTEIDAVVELAGPMGKLGLKDRGKDGGVDQDLDRGVNAEPCVTPSGTHRLPPKVLEYEAFD